MLFIVLGPANVKGLNDMNVIQVFDKAAAARERIIGLQNELLMHQEALAGNQLRFDRIAGLLEKAQVDLDDALGQLKEVL